MEAPDAAPSRPALDLDAVSRRCEAATPGPWKAYHRDGSYSPADDESNAGLGLEVDGPPDAVLRGTYRRSADAQFIAHAREDIPALLARVRELEQEAAALRARVAQLQRGILAASDALIEKDAEEAYHNLYSAIDPDFKVTGDGPFQQLRRALAAGAPTPEEPR